MLLLKKAWFLAGVLVLAGLCSSCGSSSAKHTQQQDSLALLIKDGKIDQAYAMAKDMALQLDDLTPDETVTVLLAYLEAHNKAQGKDREIMREYLDIYEISTSDNPRDMQDAFNRALEVNPRVDFKKAAEEFRAALSEAEAYDELDDTHEPAPIVAPAQKQVEEEPTEKPKEQTTADQPKEAKPEAKPENKPEPKPEEKPKTAEE